MQLQYPVPPESYVTQSYYEHVARAKRNGWCSMPGPCPTGIYYYGGIDWGVSYIKILAAQDGTVSETRWDMTGYGNHVRIQHLDDYLTIYGHLSHINVIKGQAIRAGEVIGISGNSGNSTGPHLHFELRAGGVPRDPEPMLVTEITPPVPIEHPEIPKLPQAVITADMLNIRKEPSIAAYLAGKVLKGQTLPVIGIFESNYVNGGNIWLKIGYLQWIAMQYKGKQYAIWKE